jgi:integrase
MAAIRERVTSKGTRRYHVQVRMTGFPARTASFPTRRQAERWARTIEGQMVDGRHFRDAEARNRTLAEAIDRYVLEEVPKKRDGRMHTVNLSWWRRKLGSTKLADITPAVLIDHRSRLQREPYRRADPTRPKSEHEGGPVREYERSASTVNRYLAALSHVFTVARREWQWLHINPMENVGKLKEPGGRDRFLSREERMRLLKEARKDPALYTLVVLALSTAARAGELTGLRWSDVDLKNRRMVFRETKNNEQRSVWIPDQALRLLKKRVKARKPDEERVFASARVRDGTYDYTEPFAKACGAAGVEGFRFHDLRHSAATYLARAGATTEQLKAIGGWKSGVASRYVHLVGVDAQAVQKKMVTAILKKSGT